MGGDICRAPADCSFQEAAKVIGQGYRHVLFQCINNESILSESGDPECLFSQELNLSKELNKTNI